MTRQRVPARRLGFLMPSVNVVLEGDLRALLPKDTSAHVARITWRARQSEEELISVRRAAAEQIADTRPQAVGFACSAETMVSAAETDAVIGGFADLIDAPIVPAGTALVRHLNRVCASRIAVLTPVEAESAAHEIAFLRQAGFTVVRSDVLGIADPAVIADVPAAEIAEMAARWEGLDIDAGVILCATFRGVDAAGLLSGSMPVPVVALNAATIEATLTAGRTAVDWAAA